MLTAEHLHKRYGPVTALFDASITIHAGEIHGLVGENGAGKSTLVRLLSGIEPPDGGYVGFSPPTVEGSCAVVPQYPRPARSLPVFHNLIIGAEPRRHTLPILNLFLDSGRARRRLREIALRFDIELDLDKPAGSLNGTELRLAALLAALMHDPAVLILDEPTVGLAITDQQRILATIRALRADGRGILYISHDLAEVCDVADRVTVLMQGKTTTTFDKAPDAQTLASILFDHHLPEISQSGDPSSVPRSPDRSAGGSAGSASDGAAISFEQVKLYDRHSGRTVGPVSFSIAPGTITAVTGVRESGLDLLEQYLSCEGELSAGSIRVSGRRIPAKLVPGTLLRQGIAFVPSDRFERAAALEGSIEENATITDRHLIHPRGIRTPGEAGAVTRRLLKRFDIRTNRHLPLGSLSGGTIQKLILARELETSPAVCIIAEPTAGLDLRSQEVLLESLREIAAAGAGVLLLSSSIDAVTSLSSQVVVLHDGVVQGIFSSDRSDVIARAFAGLAEPAGSTGGTR